MDDRRFVLVINEKAFGESVQEIGNKLLELNNQGIYSGGRRIEDVLKDVRMGVRDKLLLHTQMGPKQLEDFLKKNLRKNYKFCSIEWI